MTRKLRWLVPFQALDAVGPLIDPIRARPRRLATINASDHTCPIPDAVRDFSASPALVTLARGVVRGFTLFAHGGRRNGVASSSRLQPPTRPMCSFLLGVR